MALGFFEVVVSRNVFDCDDISVYLLIRLGLVSVFCSVWFDELCNGRFLLSQVERCSSVDQKKRYNICSKSFADVLSSTLPSLSHTLTHTHTLSLYPSQLGLLLDRPQLPLGLLLPLILPLNHQPVLLLLFVVPRLRQKPNRLPVHLGL